MDYAKMLLAVLVGAVIAVMMILAGIRLLLS